LHADVNPIPDKMIMNFIITTFEGVTTTNLPYSSEMAGWSLPFSKTLLVFEFS
jgi:hypothetical protein